MWGWTYTRIYRYIYRYNERMSNGDREWVLVGTFLSLAMISLHTLFYCFESSSASLPHGRLFIH